MKKLLLTTTILLAAASLQAESGKLVLASLNPIAADLARQVGGDTVEVVELMDNRRDPHNFSPDPSDLQAASAAKIFLAMGKGLETYLSDIEAALSSEQSIFELGRMVPSLRMNRADAIFACCPVHAHGSSIDPHWWHSPPRMRKAAILLSKRLAYSDPQNAEQYRKNAEEYADRIQEMHEWARQKLGRIPRRKRILTTSHAAFNYLCDEYGLQAMPINGLSSMEEPKPFELTQIVDTIRRENIPAIFPESTTSDKLLQAIGNETGVEIGRTLYAGNLPPENPTYIHLMRHNIGAISKALRGEED